MEGDRSIVEEEYYTYLLLNPLKPGKFQYEGIDQCFLFEPFYVGKGKGNRMYQHFKDIKKVSSLNKTNNTYKNIILFKIKKAGAYPIILKIFKSYKEDYVFAREKELIFLIGRRDLETGPLGNLTGGGEGINNISLTTRIKMSESHKGKIPSNIEILKNYYKNYTKDELFEKTSKAGKSVKNRKGRIVSKETRSKLSLKSKNRSYSEKHRKKFSNAAKIREASKTEEEKRIISTKISKTKKEQKIEPPNKKVLNYSKEEFVIFYLFFIIGLSCKNIKKFYFNMLSLDVIRGVLKKWSTLSLYSRQSEKQGQQLIKELPIYIDKEKVLQILNESYIKVDDEYRNTFLLNSKDYTHF